MSYAYARAYANDALWLQPAFGSSRGNIGVNLILSPQ
jgi:hypothetical protein